MTAKREKLLADIRKLPCEDRWWIREQVEGRPRGRPKGQSANFREKVAAEEYYEALASSGPSSNKMTITEMVAKAHGYANGLRLSRKGISIDAVKKVCEGRDKSFRQLKSKRAEKLNS